jgi:hypothetical protein
MDRQLCGKSIPTQQITSSKTSQHFTEVMTNSIMFSILKNLEICFLGKNRNEPAQIITSNFKI